MIHVEVAAGILRFADGRVLLGERPAGKILGGYLEFPGGKCEPGESPYEALTRELDEELGVTVTDAEPLVQFEHAYPERLIRAFMFRVTGWRGEPHGREGQKLVRAALEELPELPLLPANRPILSALGLPETLLVTPRLDAGDTGAFTARLERAMHEHRPDGAIVRLKDANIPGHEPLLRELAACAERENCRLLLNAGRVCKPPDGFSGLHLPASILDELDARPDVAGRVGASVHTEAEARKSGELGLDYVVAGSVRKTPSHPGAAPLGWSGFDAIVRAAGVPVYAIGGMTPADRAEARRHWGQGVAAIRAFLAA